MKCAKCGGNLATNGGLCETCARWTALIERVQPPVFLKPGPGVIRFDLTKYIVDVQMAMDFLDSKDKVTFVDIVEWAQRELIVPSIVEMMFEKCSPEDERELTRIYGGLDIGGKTAVLCAAYREKQRMAAPEVSNA